MGLLTLLLRRIYTPFLGPHRRLRSNLVYRCLSCAYFKRIQRVYTCIGIVVFCIPICKPAIFLLVCCNKAVYLVSSRADFNIMHDCIHTNCPLHTTPSTTHLPASLVVYVAHNGEACAELKIVSKIGAITLQKHAPKVKETGRTDHHGNC